MSGHCVQRHHLGELFTVAQGAHLRDLPTFYFDGFRQSRTVTRTCVKASGIAANVMPQRHQLRRLFRGEPEWPGKNKADITQALRRESGGIFNESRAMLFRRSAGYITLDRTNTVDHLRAVLFAVAAVLSGAAAAACAEPPVTTQEHAECIAREFVDRGDPKWELAYRAEQTPNAWIVTYAPLSSNVRGGAGTLEIERLTGKVKVREAFR